MRMSAAQSCARIKKGAPRERAPLVLLLFLDLLMCPSPDRAIYWCLTGAPRQEVHPMRILTPSCFEIVTNGKKNTHRNVGQGGA